MKKSLLVLFFFVSCLVAYSQQNLQDVVYLKNGSSIRGTVIDKTPDQSLKIQTSDGSLFVFEMAKVEKITREPKLSSPAVNLTDKRKGFIGTSLGVSIPVGAYTKPVAEGGGDADVGFHWNLLTFGYLFAHNTGITSSLSGGINPITPDVNWSYANLMVGPLLSIPLSEKIEWDVKPVIGLAAASLNLSSISFSSKIAVGFGAGTQLRFNVGKSVALLFSADYFYCNPKFDPPTIDDDMYIYSKAVSYKQPIGVVTLCFGVAYRIR